MIEALSRPSQTSAAIPIDAEALRRQEAQGFQEALISQAQAQWRAPIAQRLLGMEDDEVERRQRGSGDQGAKSISELSGMGVADLGVTRQVEAGNASPGPADAQTRRLPRNAAPREAVRQQAASEQNAQRSASGARSPEAFPARVQADESVRAHSQAQSERAPASRAPVQTARQSLQQPAGGAGQGRQSARVQGPAGGAAARSDPAAAMRTLTTAQRGLGQAGSRSMQPQMRPFSAQVEQETKLAAQLSRGLAAVLRQGGGSVTMRLQPEALGDLTIRMDMRPGRVNASFEVQNESARRLLDQNMTLLRSALEARGMDVERLEVRMAEPAERGSQARDAAPGSEREHHSGGAGTEGEQGQRWSALHRYADGGAGGTEPSPEGDSEDSALEALNNTSAALQVWMQQVEMGGAQVMRLRLDAVA